VLSCFNLRTIWAFWSYDWFTVSGNPPYLLLSSTGWDDYYNTGREYIQGRFRGINTIDFESEYRFGITANGLIGGVIFGDAESFFKQIPSKTHTIDSGWGIGIRIRLNKFSGANLCLDYGWGLNGSQGIFVNLGEVF